MPFTEMVTMIAVAAAVLLAAVHLLRLIGLLVVHRTLRKAIDRSPEQTGPLLDRLSMATAEARTDDRTGMLLVLAGIALIIGSIIINDASWMHYAIAAALFPLLMGTGLWIRDIWEKRRARGE